MPRSQRDDLIVSACHDVFSAHQELFNGVGQAPLEQDGLVDLAQCFEQLEILHVSCTHLNDVHALLLEERDVPNAHNLGYDRQAGLCFGFFQKLEALCL